MTLSLSSSIHINTFCVELLYVSDVLRTESSRQIVLKKSGEGSDADKIKYPNEKSDIYIRTF